MELELGQDESKILSSVSLRTVQMKTSGEKVLITFFFFFVFSTFVVYSCLIEQVDGENKKLKINKVLHSQG